VPSAADLAPTDASTPGDGAAVDDDGGTGGPASSTKPATPTPPGTQVERAEAMYACLSDRGFAAVLEDIRPNESWVWVEPENPQDSVVQVDATGQSFFWSKTNWSEMGLGDAEATQARTEWIEKLAKAAAESPYGYVVYAGEVDRTEDFGACADLSGYLWPLLDDMDPAKRLEQKQRIAEASNDWAACARAHGVPGVVDARVTEEDSPVALLPAGVIEGQIRELLVQCPPFDQALLEANQEALAQGRDDDVRATPIIGFDVDGYREQEADGAPSAEDEAIYGPLWDLLWSQRSAYYATLPDPDAGAGADEG
jgi:hypothetical protein